MKTTHLEADDSHRSGRGEPSPLAKTTTLSDSSTVGKQRSAQSQQDDQTSIPLPPSSNLEQSRPATAQPRLQESLDSDPNRVLRSKSVVEPAPSLERQPSVQSNKPSFLDGDASSLYSGYGGYKPKIKLGPRPSLDYSKRPTTAGSQSGDFRPVASLPAGIRSKRPQSTAQSRPSSRKSERSQISGQTRFQQEDYHAEPLPTPTNIPLGSLYRTNLVEPPAPPSTAARSVISTSSKSSGVTPEKQRLMKALQMRRRQLAEKVRVEEQKLREAAPEPVDTRPTVESGSPQESSHPQNDPDHQSEMQEVDAEKEQDPGATRVLSPISNPDTSEGPSTQGSTFTEEADRSTLDTQDHSFGPDSPKQLLLDSNHDGSAENDVTEESMKEEIASTETITSPKLEAEFKVSVQLPATPSKSPAEGKMSEDTVVPAEPNLINITIDDATEALPVIEDQAKHSPNKLSTDMGTKTIYKHKKRPSVLDTAKLGVPIASSDASDLSDDESLMEGLDTASLHEAKPISVSRSPITPVFAKLNQFSQGPDRTTSLRSVSNPVTKGRDRSPVRTASAGSGIAARWPPKADPTPNLAVKKVNVSSGISKRIKALEMFSSREPSSSPPPAQANLASSTPKSPLSAFRKRSSIINKTMAPNMTTSTPPPASLPYPSPAATPEISQSHNTSVPSSPTTSPHKKRKSVSVTARIIRAPSDLTRTDSGITESSSILNLHRSPLIIERENSDTQTTVPGLSDLSKSGSSDLTRREKRFSFSSTQSFSRQSISIPDMIQGRASFSGRRESYLHGAPSETSSIISTTDDKKESRRSRLMKRMSALASPRRIKTGMLSPGPKPEDVNTPTIQEGVEPEREPSIRSVMPQEVDIGDLNVQFPDTLLWKRRFMRIDDQGYLILTPPTMDGNTRNISKRYHLSEFRRPTIPDLDRQELPHSILLDFEDGSTLQCACESKYTQHQVLRSTYTASAD